MSRFGSYSRCWVWKTNIPQSQCLFVEAGLRSSSSSSSSSSDAVIVSFSPARLGPPLGQEEGDGAQEAEHHQDEQLPVQQQVVTVEEGQGGHDGLQGGDHNMLQHMYTLPCRAL